MKEFLCLFVSYLFLFYVGFFKICKYIKIKFFLVNCFDLILNGICDNLIEVY